MMQPGWYPGPTIQMSNTQQEVNKKFWEELIAYFPWYDTGHIKNEESNNSSIVACVFVTAVTLLQSRCLAMIREILPSLCLATIGGYTDTHTCTATWSHKPTLYKNRLQDIKRNMIFCTVFSFLKFWTFFSKLKRGLGDAWFAPPPLAALHGRRKLFI
jgi:hypothetical protein